MNALLDQWEASPYVFTESTLMWSAHALGYHFVATDLENRKEYRADLERLYILLLAQDQDPWLSKFIRSILNLAGNTLERVPHYVWTPNDLLLLLEEELDQFDSDLESARKVLKYHPEAVAAELQTITRPPSTAL